MRPADAQPGWLRQVPRRRIHRAGTRLRLMKRRAKSACCQSRRHDAMPLQVSMYFHFIEDFAGAALSGLLDDVAAFNGMPSRLQRRRKLSSRLSRRSISG